MNPLAKHHWRKATDHVSYTNYIASRAGSQVLNGQSDSTTRVPRPAGASVYAPTSSQQRTQQLGENSTYFQGHPANLQHVQHQPQGYQWPDQAASQQGSPPGSTGFQGVQQQPAPHFSQQSSLASGQYALSLPQQPPPLMHQDRPSQGTVHVQHQPNYTYPPATNGQYPAQDHDVQQAHAHNGYQYAAFDGRRSPERRATYDPYVSAYEELRPRPVQRVWTAPVTKTEESVWHNCEEHWDIWQNRCTMCPSPWM